MSHGRKDDAHPKPSLDRDDATGPEAATESAAGWSAFDHNPEGAAVAEWGVDVLNSAASPDRQEVANGHARAVAAFDLLAAQTGEEATRTEANERIESHLHMLACAPALTVDDVASKLAGLVLELARSGGSGTVQPGIASFLLASCALADLTILRRGAIPLPPRAFDPVTTPEGVAYWRQRAEGKRP
jgi:hypothetical protein